MAMSLNSQQSQGAERLALLGKHSQVLMLAYQHNGLDDDQLSDAALRKLTQAKLLWRQDEDQRLRLHPLLAQLIASLTQDESRRRVHADVADALDQMHHYSQGYLRALALGGYLEADRHLQELEQQVQLLLGQFHDAIDSLWHRLNSDFGFVSHLADKIHENERAQKQIRKLLDGLQLIEFDELIQMTQQNAKLRKLLVSQLQPQISSIHSSLFAVQRRLVQLMSRFRQQQARTQLVYGFSAFLKQHSNFQCRDYCRQTLVPELFNVAPLALAPAALALDRPWEQEQLAALVRALPASKQRLELPNESRAFSHQPMTMINQQQLAIKADVEQFLLTVLVEGQRWHSGLDYLLAQQLPWQPELWLLQILAEYQGLAMGDQQRLQLLKVENLASVHNQLRLISDLQLCFGQADD